MKLNYKVIIACKKKNIKKKTVFVFDFCHCPSKSGSCLQRTYASLERARIAPRNAPGVKGIRDIMSYNDNSFWIYSLICVRAARYWIQNRTVLLLGILINCRPLASGLD